MFCPQCGSNNDDNVRFCFNCGRRLTDGSEDTAPQSGGGWRDFQTPTPAPPVVPRPVTQVPPSPAPTFHQASVLPRQVVIGAPRRGSALGPIFIALSVVALIVAVGFAVVRLVDIDTDDWPLVGKKEKAESRSGGRVLVSLSGPCRDAAGQPCNVVLDILDVKVTPTNTQVVYEAKASGQANCSVALPPDKEAIARQEAAGKPGPYLEGGRGRYYPLLASEGFLATGGALACDKPQKGSWAFQPVPGEKSVKLRYPAIPAARLDLEPVAGRVLQPDDPISVIPVQSIACTTAQNQPCRGGWEIGPYGMGIDGSPTVFFSVRFEGPPNCTIAWQPLLGVHQREVAAGRKGIHLALSGTPPGDLTLTGVGGMASSATPQPCNQVLSGFWRFASGKLTPTVTLMNPDFPPVQIPIKP